MDPILETSRLLVRKLSLADIERLALILGDLEVMRYSLKGAQDQAGITDFVNKALIDYEQHGYGIWAVILKETGQLIGLVGLIDQQIDDAYFVELAYRFAKKFWGYGYATEAAEAIKDYAFNKLNIERLISIIEPANRASLNVARKIGMIRAKSTMFHGFNVNIYDIQKIKLMKFDPTWHVQYEEEKKLLQQAFSQFPITFYPIGSTSIPACYAKPIIDILGVTSDVLKIDPFNGSLENIGYIALGEYGMKQRRFFCKRINSLVNLHIFEDSDPEVARHLRFRDYLIAHPEETRAYSALKQKNSEVNSTDIKQYILGKESFIKRIDYLAAIEDSGKYWMKTSSPKRDEWTQEEIVHAMETNMHLQMTYFSKYLSTISLYFEPDVTVVISEIPDDTFNYVIGARFEEKEALKRVEHVVKLFEVRKKPFSWWLSERDRPSFLASLLEKQELSFKEENIGMSLLLDKHVFKRTIEALEIRRVLNQASFKDFAEVMVSCDGYPQVYEQFFKKIPPVLYSEGAPFEVYIGYVEDVPVVTGILVLHANVGGIYYVMTHPNYRKRGYGTEMIISLLMKMQERGYHIATLQASSEGKSLYQKLGFEAVCRFIEYAKNA